eukprot:NODE_3461_length_972_cov_32.803900_g3178_i0.p3 GENE.NODE_3461_length_972_cov_32.803900_g3178_i0~~NODE_3461_length_972_cov_32.803900_g3178_i0.p3  ORF type:complete len:120 (+),score=6.71 NODE_3461_length_972_cov_32.803900_g3178_i0:49-408(+)
MTCCGVMSGANTRVRQLRTHPSNSIWADRCTLTACCERAAFRFTPSMSDTQKREPLQLVQMNSFSTSADTKEFLEDEYLAEYKAPKILTDTFEPTTWSKESRVMSHSCHGDLYAAFGWL